ncbi:MAG: NAD(P)-dependent oxidoreductase [Bacteroidetes bacterium]|nr:NAD(P)-dependent oxidoreductase [Bacteroidota bacterium]
MNVKFVYGDILDKRSIEKAIGDNEIIIHLVGLQSFSEYSKKLYDSLYETNVLGLKNLLDVIVSKKLKKLKKIVFLSSTAAVGLTNGKVDEMVECNPFSAYQRTKYEGEKLCLDYVKKYNLPIVILRPSMIYGTNDDHSQIQKMVGFVKKGFFPIIGNGKNNIPMIYIDDVVRGITMGALNGKSGNIYYITNDKKTTMNELVDIIGKKLSRRAVKIKVPVFIAYMGVSVLELMYSFVGKRPSMSRRRILSMSSNRIFDVSKAKNELGFIPKISVSEGISKAIEVYAVK